jgi:hypothetical protein
MVAWSAKWTGKNMQRRFRHTLPKELRKMLKTSAVIVDVPTTMREVLFHVESATVKANLLSSPLLKYFGSLYVDFGLVSQNVRRIQTGLGRHPHSNLFDLKSLSLLWFLRSLLQRNSSGLKKCACLWRRESGRQKRNFITRKPKKFLVAKLKATKLNKLRGDEKLQEFLPSLLHKGFRDFPQSL